MQTFEEFYDKLRKNNSVKIVEGKKDKQALESLEINNIHYLKGNPLYKIVELFENEKEIILLTDLDTEGRKLFSVLSKQFQKKRVKINNKFREFLFKNKVSHIESLK